MSELTRKCLKFWISHSLKQVITRPNRITDQTATDRVSPSGVINLGLSDNDLIHYTGITFSPKFHKHNQIFVRSVRKYSFKKFLENLRKIAFSNFLTYTCANDASLEVIYRFVEAINFIAPEKKIEVKANTKPWFNNEII